jgi:transmembrane sensor
VNDKIRESSDSDEAVEAQAAAWLAERDDGMSQEDLEAFARWRQEDSRHDTAVIRLERTWQALQQLRNFRPQARMHPDCDLLAPRARPRLCRAPALAFASALVALLGVVMVRWIYPSAQAYSTAAAGYQHVLLSDGTVMEMRAETDVVVRFGREERRVQLKRGEAHFTVAKDRERPFFVTAGDVSVRAVGTAFNVIHAGDKVEVLVTEGRVAIEDAKKMPRVVSQELPALQAGDRAVLASPTLITRGAEPAPMSIVVEKLAPEKIREALAWQGPRLVFFETPLSEVVAQFNRHNTVQLVLGDPELGSIPVGGSFRAENLEAFVRLLSDGNGIDVIRSGNRLELRRSPESQER